MRAVAPRNYEINDYTSSGGDCEGGGGEVGDVAIVELSLLTCHR